eukprot:9483818-Pyramimonas_sp.AAC.2
MAQGSEHPEGHLRNPGCRRPLPHSRPRVQASPVHAAGCRWSVQALTRRKVQGCRLAPMDQRGTLAPAQPQEHAVSPGPGSGCAGGPEA